MQAKSRFYHYAPEIFIEERHSKSIHEASYQRRGCLAVAGCGGAERT